MSRLLVFTATLLLWSHLAWALPAPKTEAELMKASDLVVDAKCVTIVCLGQPVDDGKKIITSYKSTLWPSKTYKGGLPNSFVIKGQHWKYKGTPPVGGWHQEPVPKGWAGKLYLKKLPDGTYTKVWWNASVADKVRSKPDPLPLCTGDGGVPDAAVPDAAVPDKAVPDKAVPDKAAPDKPLTPDLPHEGAVPDDPMGPDLKPSPGLEGPHAEGDPYDGGVADGGETGDTDEGCSCSVRQTGGAPALLTMILFGLMWLRRRKAGR